MKTNRRDRLNDLAITVALAVGVALIPWLAFAIDLHYVQGR